MELLGFPEENDWVLHAPYSDKSLMRNALAFHLGRSTGRYASRFRFCEVVVDGDYQGVYVLLEPIKDDDDRVDLADSDSLGGGYIAKLDKRTGGDRRDVAVARSGDRAVRSLPVSRPRGGRAHRGAA